MYLGGAFGAEMAGARWAFMHGRRNFAYELFRDVEEVLEMVGTLIFTYAPTEYMETHLRESHVRLGR